MEPREHRFVSVYWCELAWLGGDRVDAGVAIEVEGDRITAVTRGVAAPPGDAVRLGGVTLPGLANAHSHAFHRALRGTTQSEGGRGAGSFWTWREQMYALADRLDPDQYLALARATFAGDGTRRASRSSASSTTCTTIATVAPTPMRTGSAR